MIRFEEMDAKERLNEYIEKDEIYQDYKQDKLMNASDFEKFCIQHCKDIDEILEENQELNKHLEVPETCNLKTLEDYKSYYKDTTREQILEDTYIEYCAYVNLAHRYSELKKQLEQYQEEVCILDMRTDENIKLINQQKEFIKYLEDMLEDENDIFSVVRVKDVLSKYKEIIGDDK